MKEFTGMQDDVADIRKAISEYVEDEDKPICFGMRPTAYMSAYKCGDCKYGIQCRKKNREEKRTKLTQNEMVDHILVEIKEIATENESQILKDITMNELIFLRDKLEAVVNTIGGNKDE